MMAITMMTVTAMKMIMTILMKINEENDGDDSYYVKDNT